MAVFAVSASAADLPSRTRQPATPVVAATPAFTWTGLYAGVNAGYGWSSGEKLSYRGDAASLAYAGSGVYPTGLSSTRSGFVGGGQIGANYQMGQFVAGIETDLMGIGSAKRVGYTLASGTNGSFKDAMGWLGTTRVRLGYTPVNRLLVYATGGAAYGSTKHHGEIVAPSLGGARWFGRDSDTRFGWALGAGGEYAITNNLIARLEYLYYDLGRSNLALAAANAPAVALGNTPLMRHENRGSIVRAGLNYKF
ncbi:MAG TPA: porin family protein [Beijerinckiaceae bacterium]|nr:porin family protein [Beijerinckiaceae bacterium]